MINEYWHIVPKNDGYNVLCYKNGEYYLVRKENILENTTDLNFNSEEDTLTYIREHLDVNEYEPELYWTQRSR
jgi:hypothetical protein